MAVVFRSYTVTTKLRLMYLEVKTLQIGTNAVFKGKQAIKKVPLYLLELGMYKIRYNW